MPASRPLDIRFWEKVDTSGECWIWTGGMGGGYGQIWDGQRVRYAHRISYQMHIGPIPDGLQIDHMCHNRKCVNPKHLQAVTPKENSENFSGALRTSKSGVRGVHWSKAANAWVAQVQHNRHTRHLGVFATIKEAAAAAAKARCQLHTNNLADRSDEYDYANPDCGEAGDHD